MMRITSEEPFGSESPAATQGQADARSARAQPSLFDHNLREHCELFESLSVVQPAVEEAACLMADSLTAGGKLMFCGNGGSAADSQHLAAELTGRLVHDRRPLAAIALSTDTSTLTCIANDYSFSQVFERQVIGLGHVPDCIVAISTSGNSENLVRALKAANQLGLTTVGLLGRDGGRMACLCDVSVIVPSETTARIQEAHIFIGHTLCGLVERRLGLG